MDGHIRDGHPLINFKLSGFSRDLEQEFEGIIDTGFSGFLLLPLVKALPVGLILVSTANYNLADNSTHPTLLCLGNLALKDGTEAKGVVSVSNSDTDVLLGVEFLQKAQKQLVFCPTTKKIELHNITPQQLSENSE